MKTIIYCLSLVLLITSVFAMNEVVIVKDIITSTSTKQTTSFLLDIAYYRYTLTPSIINYTDKSCFFTLNEYNFTLYENQGTDFDLNANNLTDWSVYLYKVDNGTIDITIQNKETNLLSIPKDTTAQNKALAISVAMIFGVYLILYRREATPRKII